MQELRHQLLLTAQKLSLSGLNRGTSGNVSVRCGDGFLVTPSGMKTEVMSPDDMVHMNFLGEAISIGKPSSEWRFHRDILQSRTEINAIVHTHSMFATTLACLSKEVPSFHYMIALVGGDTIRCAPYALFGSQALSDVALTALQSRNACLLANHGMIALGKNLEQAYDIALEVETLCEQYWRALQIGEPNILNAEQMLEVTQQFRGYGSWGK